MDISVKSKLILMQWGIAYKGDVNDEKNFVPWTLIRVGKRRPLS